MQSAKMNHDDIEDGKTLQEKTQEANVRKTMEERKEENACADRINKESIAEGTILQEKMQLANRGKVIKERKEKNAHFDDRADEKSVLEEKLRLANRSKDAERRRKKKRKEKKEEGSPGELNAALQSGYGLSATPPRCLPGDFGTKLDDLDNGMDEMEIEEEKGKENKNKYAAGVVAELVEVTDTQGENRPNNMVSKVIKGLKRANQSYIDSWRVTLTFLLIVIVVFILANTL